MIEFVITLFAVVWAVSHEANKLSVSLLVAWILSLAGALWFTAEYLPGFASIIDAGIAASALAIWTEKGSQRARLVGAVSLFKLCCHFGISTQFGSGNWFLYAITINSLFVLQCLIAGGAFRGLAGFIDGFSPRHRSDRKNYHHWRKK